MNKTAEQILKESKKYEEGLINILNLKRSQYQHWFNRLMEDNSELYETLSHLIDEKTDFSHYSKYPQDFFGELEYACYKDKNSRDLNLLLLISSILNEPEAITEEFCGNIKKTSSNSDESLKNSKESEKRKEFIHNSSHFIFKEAAKTINQLCGLSKTSSMIANLFTNLPLKIEARFIETQPKPSKKLNSLGEYVHAYVKHDDLSAVYIAFFYSNERHFDRIIKALNKHPEFFAYLYMREALKLVRFMNTKTHYNMMSGIIQHNNPSISIERRYALSQRACNFAVNDTIHKLFVNSPIISKLDRIFEGQDFNPAYSGQSEMIILKDLIEFDPTATPAITKLDPQFSYDDLSGQIFDSTNGTINTDESIQTDLGESISTQLASMSRGGTSESIFSELFQAKKVHTGWFKKLAAKFNREVYYMTNTFSSQWSSLNVTYRNKFKAPKVKYEDNKLAVIVSIDHSGSVSTDGLQKLLYLFEKHSKRITQLFVLIHDTEVVKQFKLESDFDIKTNPQFVEALAHRFAVGGTSHYDVFNKINEMLINKTLDPSKTIYVSFSDNYSDIPKSWAAFPNLSKLSTTFLSPVDNPVNVPGTTDITMQ